MEQKFHIDRRPLPFLFLKEYRSAIVLALIAALFIFAISNPVTLPGLSPEGYRSLVIFFLAITLWVTNILPLAITSLLIMGLLASYTVLDSKQIYSFFGNSSLFFILGAFIISAGVQSSGLSRRAALFFLRKFGHSPFSLATTVFILSAGLSHVMPEHAVAALMLPIVLEIITVSHVKKGSAYGGLLFFSMAWGCIIGGVVTFLGGARNPLAIGMLQEMTGKTIHMTQWIAAAAPPMYLLSALVIGWFYFAIRKEAIPPIDLSRLKQLPKLSFREIKAGSVLAVTIFMWIFFNKQIGIANVALVSASLFFILNIITWDEASREINWGILFMYGGAIAMGTALDEVGVLQWFVDTYMMGAPMSKPVLLGILVLASMILTEFMSNAAVIAIILPVSINIGIKMGLSPELITLAVALPSGLSYMLPMSTPAMAMIYGSGYIDGKAALRRGFVLDIISWILIMAAALWYWPMLGIK